MASREEIREGLAEYILVCGNKPDVYTPDMCAEDLMEYLHSQGVAIKVDRELPLVSEADVEEWNEAVKSGIIGSGSI